MDNINDIKLPLGKKTTLYPDTLDSSLLYPIERSFYRKDLPHTSSPLFGYDILNSYEFCWLDSESGWPVHGHLQIAFDHQSRYIIESKSLKLYLGSFAHSLFSYQQVTEQIKKDLTPYCGEKLEIHFNPEFYLPYQWPKQNAQNLKNLENLEGQFDVYFDSFKSLCPVTSSPDYATFYLKGTLKQRVSSVDILEYLASFANKKEFHEHCVENIFITLSNLWSFSELTVKGYFTRRGSLDIHPWRSSQPLDRSRWRREYWQ